MTTLATDSLIVVVYAFAVWLGLYLCGRDPRSPRLLLTGLGLLAYALALACDLVASVAGLALALALERVLAALLLLPALFWTGALAQLIPEKAALRDRAPVPVPMILSAATTLLPLASIAGDLALADSSPLAGKVVHLILGAVVLVPLLVLVVLVRRSVGKSQSRQLVGTLVVASLFFLLSTGLIVFPLTLVPRLWAILLLGFDLGWLGLVIARYDAFDLGEAIVPDMSRSFAGAALTTLVFGGQTALVIGLTSGPTTASLALLLTTITTAIAIPTFGDRLSTTLDRVALGRLTQLRAARAELRATASALPRRDLTLDPSTLDVDELIRHTRRALSQFGDLPRLGSNPLINLTLIDRRLAARRAPDDPLERTIELKAVLAESIARLKPRNGEAFGTSDEWRLYNALYFPYVLGLRPYSSRENGLPTDPVARTALTWFRDVVPERTLHNWQTAAARLVALDLRSKG
jgi:hypothetical protein